MFDIGASELLVILIVAVLVIGPKDMPRALRTAGRWIGKMRRVSGHFRAGLDEMVRQAEIEDMEQKWAKRNQEIMARYPDVDMTDTTDGEMRPLDPPPTPADADAAAEAAIGRAAPRRDPAHGGDASPTLSERSAQGEP